MIAFYSYTSESGKDTATRFAIDSLRKRGYDPVRCAFADPMKKVCAQALGVAGTTEDQVGVIDQLKLRGEVVAFSENEALVSPQDGRDFIIGLAEGIRSIDPEFWIKAAIADVGTGQVPVISDMRFQPEATFVRQHGGTVVEIQRPDTVHRNEDRIRADFVIQNNRDLGHLSVQIEKLIDIVDPTL